MSELEKQKNFQERMIERVKDSIGDLMTNDELSNIVKRAMEEIFFKPTVLKDGFHTKEAPPFIHQLIKELLTREVNAAVNQFLADNKDYVAQKIQDVITQGVGLALINTIKLQFNNDLMNFQSNLMENIQNR